MSDLVNIYIGRQPIFDGSMRVFAYELLFRSNTEDNHANILGGDAATAQVMINLFGDMGFSSVVGEHKAFINFTEGMLLRENRPFFKQQKVIIEVLESIKPTKELMTSLQQLRKDGYRIALDDYDFNDEYRSLEEYADIIKVDILAAGPKKIIEQVPRLKEQKKLVLAEKVETREQFEFCQKVGFDYFQGYFFAKPKIIKGKSLPANKLMVLQLLSSVYDPDIDMHKLSDLISQDVSMSQKLLKMASIGSNHEISSIHDAVLRFGLNRLQSWTSVLVLSSVDDKPSELMTTSLVRAKFCEMVGEKVRDLSKETYFTVGLFSTLDAVMDAPLEELLAQLHFDAKIKQALTDQHGSLGIALNAVKSLEQGKTDFELPKSLEAADLSRMYLESMEYANKVMAVHA